MKDKFGKNMRIISDLVACCYRMGATDYRIDMSLQADLSEYRISCPMENVSSKKIEALTQTLNMPRQREIEQYYWGLSGDMDNLDHELDLVGMMVDEAFVTFEEGIFSILVRRTEGD